MGKLILLFIIVPPPVRAGNPLLDSGFLITFGALGAVLLVSVFAALHFLPVFRLVKVA